MPTSTERPSSIPLLTRSLPKWPQMLTTGSPVTPDQAKEIIRRTDTFLIEGYGGNDDVWDARLAARLRMPHFRGYSKASPPTSLNWEESQRQNDNWRKAWGAIRTEYVQNSWISTFFIHGPHGWCWPDGRIAYVDNVGRWPSVEAVLQDWSAIAKVFPFLDLAATLMSGECCEDTVPVVTILVKEGMARVENGSLRFHEAYPVAVPRSDVYLDQLFDPEHRYAHGPIPDAWYAEWEKQAQGLKLG